MSDYYSTMVNRFLGWKLPPTFGPDAGIKFAPSNGMSREEAYAKPGWWPIGTNLFTATETRAMLEHILPPMPENSYSTEAEGDAYTHGWFDGNAEPPYGKPHIAEHLFIEQRGDGKWLVCVEKVHDRMEQAQAACREWIAATGGVTGTPAPSDEEAAREAFEWDAKTRDGGAYGDTNLSDTRTMTGYVNPSWSADWRLWLRAWNAARGVKGGS
jgi:hypothetical protein